MPLRAAFAEIDITPALPCEKPGWIVKILAQRVDDPLYAHILVLETDSVRVAFVSLDVLSVRWPIAEAIRERAEKLNIPRANVMVAATHTHTGPPISAPGLATKDSAYATQLAEKVGQAMARAVEALTPAKLMIASGIESRISFIRRAIMKDGSVKTHAQPGPGIRCLEGVIDPEVGVLAVKDSENNLLGLLVNFACHPTHNGGDPILSAGWPGVMCDTIKQSLGAGVVSVFLNGALGDAHHANPLSCDPPISDLEGKRRVGQTLASTVLKLVAQMDQSGTPLTPSFASSRTTIQIPLRDIDGPHGVNMKNRQRFAPDSVYEALITKLRAKKAKHDHVLAEIQAIRITDDVAFVSLPCEPFTRIGLDIKTASPLPRTYVVGLANGIVGYVPTEEAFQRGGYETTLSMGSKLDPSAAGLMTATALDQLRKVQAM